MPDEQTLADIIAKVEEFDVNDITDEQIKEAIALEKRLEREEEQAADQMRKEVDKEIVQSVVEAATEEQPKKRGRGRPPGAKNKKTLAKEVLEKPVDKPSYSWFDDVGVKLLLRGHTQKNLINHACKYAGIKGVDGMQIFIHTEGVFREKINAITAEVDKTRT